MRKDYEEYESLIETYLQSIRNRLYDRFGNYPNSINPYTFEVDAIPRTRYLNIYITLNGKRKLYKKIRYLDKMVFNVQTYGNPSPTGSYRLREDFEKLTTEKVCL